MYNINRKYTEESLESELLKFALFLPPNVDWRMFIIKFLANEFNFWPTETLELVTIVLLFWPSVNYKKIKGYVALPSGPTVHSLYCVQNTKRKSSGHGHTAWNQLNCNKPLPM